MAEALRDEGLEGLPRREGEDHHHRGGGLHQEEGPHHRDGEAGRGRGGPDLHQGGDVDPRDHPPGADHVHLRGVVETRPPAALTRPARRVESEGVMCVCGVTEVLLRCTRSPQLFCVFVFLL